MGMRALLLLTVQSVLAMEADALQALRIARMSILASHKGVRIGQSSGKGLGAFATRQIAEFTNLGDYEGELLTQRDIDARYRIDGERRGSAELWTAQDESWLRERERDS